MSVVSFLKEGLIVVTEAHEFALSRTGAERGVDLSQCKIRQSGGDSGGVTVRGGRGKTPGSGLAGWEWTRNWR